MDRRINRREFLAKSGMGIISIGLMPSYIRKTAPSDRVRIAHIGVGGMGNNHIRWFAGLPDAEIVALCDLDKTHLSESLKSLSELRPEAKVTGYSDFRKILDRKDIDAITCATPDHWHALVAILAFESGKDVYGEKPLSYDVREGQRMLESMEKNKRIFQLGTQIHAGENYHRVVEIIQAGGIGNVHTVRLWKTGFSPGLGFPKVTRPPRELNWDMWQGVAPVTSYFPERCHRTYRYFLDYSGGVFADFWCHIADVAFWAVQPEGLKSVIARGDRTDGIADAPKWVDADFEFDGLKLFWTTTPPEVPGAGERNIGAYFEGTKGTLICDYETLEIMINGERMNDIPEIPKTLSRSPGHQQNFLDSVKSRVLPESNLPYVRKMTLPMHLAVISWRLKRKLNWDDKNARFIGDEEANSLLSRHYRKKWDLL
ncbi:MAG TPA: Gfo/Idh/MocA family oxidoreductase [Cyclobacteriaceae bacterium]|nr:Gfo/Idh/MocA family oxidoreductase [Cyclobacteriaceae bacterium]